MRALACWLPLLATACSTVATVATVPWGELRGGLGNCRARFLEERRGRVAFLGGSITHNPGWRELVATDLQRRFPGVEFDFVNAGIPSMGSTPSAFRFARDVLENGRIDLLFHEAAVNDHVNGRSATEQLRAVEGIVRQARRSNPCVDIVMLHFAMPAHTASYDSGRVPAVIRNHERVARHYGLASLDLAREVRDRMAGGEFEWRRDFRDLHPSPFGQRLYANAIARLLTTAWQAAAPSGRTPPPCAYAMPAPLDRLNYENGAIAPIDAARLGAGFERVERWRPDDRSGTRAGFVGVAMLVAERPGATLELDFVGPTVGVWVAAGPDAGILEYRIDDDVAWQQVDLFTKWSGRLHLPWLHVLAAETARESHVLHLRVSSRRNPASRGHAVRIAHFVGNER